MGRFFGLVLMLVALYVGMTLYTQGLESAFGGAFAPIQPADGRDAPLATHLTPAAQLADGPSAAAVTSGRRDRRRPHS
jgi:hypothetical protein